MHYPLYRPSSKGLSAAIIVAAALLAAYGSIMLAGSKMGAAVALLAIFGPVVAYFSLTAPLIFPFSLLVVLIPFDNLLEISSFGTLTKVLGLACGAALLLRLLRSRRHVAPDRALAAWTAFVVLAAASMMWAIDSAAGAQVLYTLIELFILYAVVALSPIDRKTLITITWAVIVSGAVAAAYSIFLFHNGTDFSHGRVFVAAAAGTPDGAESHIDPNHFAASLLLPAALAIVFVVESNTVVARLAAGASLLFMSAGLAFAGSRGALVAIAVMLLYFVVRLRRRIAVAAVVVAAIGGGLAFYGTALQRFGQIFATDGAGRLDIWKVGLLAFKQHPFLGAGFGNFPLAYNQAYLSASITGNFYWGQAPHSNVVWIMVELGSIGLLVFLYGWWAQLRALHAIGRDDRLFPLRIALEGALIALFIAGLFLGTVTYKYLWLAFMIIALTRNAHVLAPHGEREIVKQ